MSDVRGNRCWLFLFLLATNCLLLVQATISKSQSAASVLSSLPQCIVQHASWLGDGRCDTGDYNTAECNYDMGDCCPSTCSSSTSACGVAGYKCDNPAANENKSPPKNAGGGGTDVGGGGNNHGGNGGNGGAGNNGGGGNSGGGGAGGGGGGGGSGDDNDGSGGGGGGGDNSGNNGGGGGGGNGGGGGDNGGGGGGGGGDNGGGGDGGGGDNSGGGGGNNGGGGGDNGGGGGGGGDNGGGGGGGGNNGGGGGNNGGGGGDNGGGGGGGGSGNNGGGGGDNGGGGGGNNGGNINYAAKKLVVFTHTINIMNTTMDCFTETDEIVIAIQNVIRCAITQNILSTTNSSVKTVTFVPYNSNVKGNSVASNLDLYKINDGRTLLGARQSVMVAAIVTIQTQNQDQILEQTALNRSISSGVMEKSIRRSTVQSSVQELIWVKVCRSVVPTICMMEISVDTDRGKSNTKPQVALDQCSMSASGWGHLYQRRGMSTIITLSYSKVNCYIYDFTSSYPNYRI